MEQGRKGKGPGRVTKEVLATARKAVGKGAVPGRGDAIDRGQENQVAKEAEGRIVVGIWVGPRS